MSDYHVYFSFFPTFFASSFFLHVSSTDREMAAETKRIQVTKYEGNGPGIETQHPFFLPQSQSFHNLTSILRLSHLLPSSLVVLANMFRTPEKGVEKRNTLIFSHNEQSGVRPRLLVVSPRLLYLSFFLFLKTFKKTLFSSKQTKIPESQELQFIVNYYLFPFLPCFLALSFLPPETFTEKRHTTR